MNAPRTTSPSAPSGQRWGWLLAMAIVGGLLVPAYVVPSAIGSHSTDYGLLLFCGLWSLACGVVAVWASKRHRGLGWAAGGLLALFGGFTIVLAVDGIWRGPGCGGANASAAVGGLNAAVSCSIIFQSNISKNESFPRPNSASDWEQCVGPELAKALADPNVAFRGAYKFIYMPIGTPPKAYSIVARPAVYSRTGLCSFYTDETGAIRYTREDRPATAQDPDIGKERRGFFAPR